MTQSPLVFAAVRSHDTIEYIAKSMHGVGAITPDRAMLAEKITKSLTKRLDISTQAIYKILREKPGFAPTYDQGKLKYYFEAEKIMPVAKMQGAEFYPKNLAALYPAKREDLSVEPAWNISAQAGLLHVPHYSLPTLSATQLLDALRVTLEDDTVESRANKYRKILSEIATRYVLDASDNPDKELD